MQLSKITSLLSLLAVASANSITFKSLDKTDRTVYFTANAGLQALAPVVVPAGASVKADVPAAWIGNFYSVSVGENNVPGMLGEVNFNSWMDLTFFDVSAIVDPNDQAGVQQIYPHNVAEAAKISGCPGNWPCNNAYYLPDDIQTKSTPEVDLICELGVGDNLVLGAAGVAARTVEDEVPTFNRKFVVRKW